VVGGNSGCVAVAVGAADVVTRGTTTAVVKKAARIGDNDDPRGGVRDDTSASHCGVRVCNDVGDSGRCGLAGRQSRATMAGRDGRRLPAFLLCRLFTSGAYWREARGVRCVLVALRWC
jgi:hypothetical protein